MHRQTECEDIICEVDQYVSGTAAGVVGQCVDCLPHRERPFRDNVNNGDTSCSDIHCSANEYVHFFAELQYVNHDWKMEQDKIGHAQGHIINANWNFLNPPYLSVLILTERSFPHQFSTK